MLHALAVSGGGPIERRHFPEPLLGGGARARKPKSRGDILHQAAADAVRASGGNVSAAARRLGVARSTLYRMLRSK